VATLEDAAQELVVRLKGLDSEIEESAQVLQELRGRVEAAGEEVEEEWSRLAEAVSSFESALREEQEKLAAAAGEGLRATAEAQGTVQEHGAQARSSIAGAQSDLDVLSRHAAGLEPGVESLVAEAGEAPAHSLAQRAKAVEEELAAVLESARDFVQHEVTSALEELAAEVRERCDALRTRMAEEGAAALQAMFDAWEPQVELLEEHVAQEGFTASRSHAQAVVSWALVECESAGSRQLDGAREQAERAVASIEELGSAVRIAARSLSGTGGGLRAELESARGSATRADSALDGIKQLLASFSFVEA
jgi:hypothetical protein